MTEIITALIGGVFLLGGAVITARWTRSRSTSNHTPTALPPTSNPQPDDVNSNTPRPPDHPLPAGANPSIPHPPQSARPGGVTVNGQFIETNNGTVSQTNYRDGKR
ncbi:hypothetical protein [Streptomyces sp. st77]|uniref:hypothetical protein n=1 Tax=Streptomyces sp. st77 TaxID=1828074 RepID=UPI00117D56E1|nr:hypothetical protein [Streptomyces sp. st77]